MAAIIPLPSTARHPGNGSIEPEQGALPDHLTGWLPEQLWLSDACWSQAALQTMTDAVTVAVKAVVKAETAVLRDHELLLVFGYMRRETAWLRLAARVLRGPSSSATSNRRFLAASALWLAAIRHQDLLAAIEFSAETSGHAVMLEAGLVGGELVIPPGMRGVAQVTSRMRRRSRELLARRLSWPDLDTVGPCLARALRDDPLRVPD